MGANKAYTHGECRTNFRASGERCLSDADTSKNLVINRHARVLSAGVAKHTAMHLT